MARNQAQEPREAERAPHSAVEKPSANAELEDQ